MYYEIALKIDCLSRGRKLKETEKGGCKWTGWSGWLWGVEEKNSGLCHQSHRARSHSYIVYQTRGGLILEHCAGKEVRVTKTTKKDFSWSMLSIGEILA